MANGKRQTANGGTCVAAFAIERISYMLYVSERASNDVDFSAPCLDNSAVSQPIYDWAIFRARAARQREGERERERLREK